jgi:hypothetical protein
VRGRAIVDGSYLEVDYCGISLWEIEAVLGVVHHEVFFVLDENFPAASRYQLSASTDKCSSTGSIGAELGREG